MKCPNRDCGFEPEKPTKFCPECGKKMATEPKPKVVLCKNITKEGIVCNAEIQITFKFCGDCGIPVTKEMFERQIHICPQCNDEVPPGKRFCPNCGFKVVDKDNTFTTREPKVNAALTKASMVGPQGDHEKTDPTVSSASLQNVEGNNQGLDGKVETEGKSDGAENEKTHAVGESFVLVNLTEKEEFFPVDVTEASSPGELKESSVIESLPKPNAAKLPLDEEMKDQNGNSPELADKSVAQQVKDQADISQGSALNESVTMESSADSSKDSGVIGDLSPQSQEHSIPLEKSEKNNAKAMPVNAMEGVETGESAANIPNKVGGTADLAEASVLVQQFESVTIKNQLSPVTANDDNQIDSMNTIDGDEQNKNTDSESEEGDISSDDSSMKPDVNVSESYKGNERKRKKKTGKKAYKAKRERKRGKLEMSKKGEIDQERTNAPAVEKLNEQEKQKVSDIIKPHKLTETFQEQSQAANLNEVSAQKDIVMDISFDTRRDEKGKNIYNQSVDREVHTVSGISTNMKVFGDGKSSEEVSNQSAASGRDTNTKVFGGITEDETGQAALPAFDVRGPPSVESSLFELDKKPIQETDDKNKNSSPVKAAGSGSTEESLKTTGNEQRKGVETRSMTKDKENKQKKQTMDAEAMKKSDASKSGIIGHANGKIVRVHFIALISQDFNLNLETDKVYVRGDLDNLQGWKNHSHVMKYTGKHWDGCLEYEYICDIPYSHLSLDRGREYKYLIVKYKSGEKKDLWDCYLKHGRTGVGENRTLTIPRQMKSSVPDVLYKFDGIINRAPESHGILERFKETVLDYLTKSGKLKRDCEKFLEHFSANHMMFDSTSSVKENTDKGVLLLYQLKQIYMVDGKAWVTDHEFRREIGNTILRRLIDYLVTARQANDRQTSFIVALTVASLVKAFPVTELDLSDSQQGILCRALLVEANEDEKTCFEMEFINQHYSKQKNVIKDGLLQILKSVVYGKTKNPSWFFLVPLIHFLNGDCKPYDFPPSALGHQATRPTWWGMIAFEDMATNFQKRDRNWSVPLKEVLEVLHPVFRVDYFLPRTFMACLNLKEIQAGMETRKLPIDVCCASLNYFMKIAVPTWYNPLYQYNTLPTPVEMMVLQCMDLLLNCVKTMSDAERSTEAMLIHLRHSCKVAEDMFVNSVGLNRTITENLSMLIFLYCVDTFTISRKVLLTSLDKEKETKIDLKLIQEVDTSLLIQRMLTETQDWLRTHYCFFVVHLPTCLNIWNHMFLNDDYLQKETVDTWNGALSTYLERQLNAHLSNGSPERFIQTYCNSIDSYKGCMQEVMSKVVIKAVEGGYRFHFDGFHENERKRLGKLLSEMFVNYWEKTMRASSDPPDETILRLVLTWPPFTSFLQVLSKYQEDIKRDCLLSSDCAERLAIATSIIEGRCEALKTGDITVTKLRELVKHEDKFVPVVDLVKNKVFHGKMVKKLIMLRTREIAEVERKAKKVTVLTSYCHYLSNVNLAKQDAVLSKVTNIGHYSVKDFCKPLDVHSLDKIEDCHQNMTAFELSPEVDEILEPLYVANKSTTFSKLWEQQCNVEQANCSTLDDVVKHVWNIVNGKWTAISQKIASGDIVFSHLEHHVGKTFKDDYEAMKYELVVMGINEKIVAKRIKQLGQYRQLETSVKGAKVILKFAQQYHLEGDFQQIRNIALHENVEMKMKDFDESLMDTCRILQDITPYQSECLNALVSSEPLIAWLKESMKKDGLKELKVFVDLALISAGEQPLDIDRVQALNTAVLGYSPLIFDLKPDADYKELLEKCRLVWKELETNPKLSEKLVDSNRHLEWLKTIQKAHGSVEVSSLAQAEAINSNGVFSCGYVWKIQDDIVLKPTKVLKLLVRGQDKSETRNYTFDQLQDLQSRLMLVAGRAEKEKTQGKDEVEIFTEVFDGVKRLSSVYIKLYDAGCVLFKTWQASFLCDPHKPVCAILDFGQEVEKIKV